MKKIIKEQIANFKQKLRGQNIRKGDNVVDNYGFTLVVEKVYTINGKSYVAFDSGDSEAIEDVTKI